MTISLKIRYSNSFINYKKTTEIGFIIYAVPESVAKIKNTHFIIAIDNSPSMVKNGNLDIALKSAEKLLETLPQGNTVTIIEFSNHPKIMYSGATGIKVNINKESGATTRFYELITFIMAMASQNPIPTKVILLTDGKPIDKRNIKDYEKLNIPKNMEIISIGIGSDYNETILSLLADKTSGIFYHIDDPSQLPTLFEEQTTNNVHALNLSISVPQGFSPLNYDMPIKIPIVDRLISVYGILTVPPGDKDYPVNIIANYDDPVTSQNKSLSYSVVLKRANEDVVNANLNKEVDAEIKYYKLLRDYTEALEKGKEATKIMTELKQVAEETRKEDLIEYTQKMTGDAKTDLSAATRKMRQ
ncbi:VWA domain-containing protein [Acidianus brierleyi]|uniref:VWA domain-containing protein n=1 Tax=Acidianus brierleyi TaxID=41673 RepID=A0A2U9IGN1_9CREN|nr:VWA domain-containing protein [Acidianus brierleyi]AWR95193.1 VWA domain-containing protein [Acidianus brierleyi]